MKGKHARGDVRVNNARLTELEEKILIRYILDLDSRGFAPRLRNIKDIANILVASRNVPRVGTR